MHFSQIFVAFFKCNFALLSTESKYKIINVKHHRRMKRSNGDAEEATAIDSTINIKISDINGE